MSEMTVNFNSDDEIDEMLSAFYAGKFPRGFNFQLVDDFSFRVSGEDIKSKFDELGIVYSTPSQ